LADEGAAMTMKIRRLGKDSALGEVGSVASRMVKPRSSRVVVVLEKKSHAELEMVTWLGIAPHRHGYRYGKPPASEYLHRIEKRRLQAFGPLLRTKT
jgi:hypothetical protein